MVVLASKYTINHVPFPRIYRLKREKTKCLYCVCKGGGQKSQGAPFRSNKKVYFQKNAESRFAGVALDGVLECVTPDGYPFFSIVLKQCTGQS